MKEKVQKPIIKVSLDTEQDLVVAYKKAMQLSEISGLNFTHQTKFATAVSEICRNALMYAGKGEAAFFIIKDGGGYFIEAVISDQGPGINDLGALLQRLSTQTGGQKTGIINCKRLSDRFDMDSSLETGTCVRIANRLPATHPPINHIILSGWRKYFSQLAPVSPYDELKRQNHLLLETLESLKLKEIQTKEQLEEIQSLNYELAHNYGKLKQLSNDYATQNELLQKRNTELDEFAHIVSHDLKAPLNNLQGLVQLVESGQLEDRGKMVTLFKGQLQKMEQLIQSILSYSRAGHEKVQKAEVDLGKLVNDMIANLSKRQNFTIEVEPDFPIVYTEEILIFQVFSNLLTNAIKYSNKVRGNLLVGFQQTEDGEFVYFVEDDGPGIPENKREGVFHIFTTLHNEKRADSTGIGLAIVKKIISEKGGRIWIEDPVQFETGTRFCFTWPAEVI